jgi:hypothetical protein
LRRGHGDAPDEFLGENETVHAGRDVFALSMRLTGITGVFMQGKDRNVTV